MVPPPSLLRVLRTGLHVETVVLGPTLLLRRRQHGDNRETDRLDGEGRRPVVRQDGEADVSVAVDVLMQRDALPHKGHLRRVEGVLHAELEAEQEGLALVEGVGRALHADEPDPEVVSGQRLLGESQAFRRLRHEGFELLLEALECRAGDLVPRRLVHA